LAYIINISTSLRDVVCELLLRDIEQLLDRYLRKMRKSFSRMHWDEDGGEIDPTEFIEEVSAGLSFS
jgi:DnaJ-domain-containing protein 1